MTEENWEQTNGSGISDCGLKQCFLQRAVREFGVSIHLWDHIPALADVDERSMLIYDMSVASMNDTASSLSDFKAKVTALYQNGGQ